MTTAVSAIPALSAGDGLTRYLREIRKFPILSPEEEYMLAKRWQQHEDVSAAHQLVTSHLRLVAKMAFGFRHYGLPLSDLISEGNVGLMRAVKKFEPDKGFRLATYAMWWIRASLHEYVLSSWSMVRLGTLSAHKKLFFNLRKVKARLQILDSADLSAEDGRRIASALDVSEEDVQIMNQRLSGRDSSLNAPLTVDQGLERQDLLVDESPDQETVLGEREERQLQSRWLTEGLKLLDPRELDILTERRLRDNPMTLEELGVRYNVSRERIRQIENRAFARLQAAIRAQALTATSA